LPIEVTLRMLLGEPVIGKNCVPTKPRDTSPSRHGASD